MSPPTQTVSAKPRSAEGIQPDGTVMRTASAITANNNIMAKLREKLRRRITRGVSPKAISGASLAPPFPPFLGNAQYIICGLARLKRLGRIGVAWIYIGMGQLGDLSPRLFRIFKG